jgi:hypothetical protein
VTALARELHVDRADNCPSFGQALDDSAKVLSHTRARTVSAALAQALEELKSSDVAEALLVLRAGQTAQRAVVTRRTEAMKAARKALANARQEEEEEEEEEEEGEHRAHEFAAEARRAAEVVRIDTATVTAETRALAALDQVIEILDRTNDASAGIESIHAHQAAIATEAGKLWARLAELIWEFDDHLQDGLTAASERQAIAYQLGRGLAETYWALDPRGEGTTSWGFLFGEERCTELCRLVGRLSAYLDEYTAAAIAGSVEVWKEVVKTPAWLGNPVDTQQALYRQIRRWFELLVLGQDPTTLVHPGAAVKDYRMPVRVVRLFWPQLIATVVGVGFLVALLVLVSVGSSAAWAKTVSGILAVAGLSLAGLTGTLKNSAQAMLKRLRQDSYTDLVAVAVQTAPPAPKRSDVQKAIRRRTLTPATPN